MILDSIFSNTYLLCYRLFMSEEEKQKLLIKGKIAMEEEVDACYRFLFLVTLIMLMIGGRSLPGW